MENLKVKLSALKENEDNPREITKEEFDSLKKSILTFPKMLEIRPIAAAVKDGGIIYGGNMRFRALNEINKLSLIKIGEIIGSSRKAAKIGEPGVRRLLDFWEAWKKSPDAPVVDITGLSEEEIQEFIIKDNENFGDWNYDELADKWDEEDLNDWGLSVWEPEPEQKEEDKKPSGSDSLEIVVTCSSEQEQERLFIELQNRGLNCRIK